MEDKFLKVSEMAETLAGSEIIRIASAINELKKNGSDIHNLTIGDFSPEIFPIPEKLRTEIIIAYTNNHTNYPPADGLAELRKAISSFIKKYQKLDYQPNEILVSAGARPLIYALFQTLVAPGESVIYPEPSWNCNHYTHLAHAKSLLIETNAEGFFMPAAESMSKYINKAVLVSLCSPLNPTGTMFSKESLSEICELILKENEKRIKDNRKPVYLLFDQVYWMLTHGDNKHHDPVSLNIEMKNYTIFIDGISKTFAATGVRVGWAFGSARIIGKMKSILSHLGAWAPKAEQIALARYLSDTEDIDSYLKTFKSEIIRRLIAFYSGFKSMKESGFPVDAIKPQATIYLTIKVDLFGKKDSAGTKFVSNRQIADYLLKEAKTAVIPFFAFGSSEQSPWFRISVGTCSLSEIEKSLKKIKTALGKVED